MTTKHTMRTLVQVHAAASLRLNPHNYTNDEVVEAVRHLINQEPHQWLTETEPVHTDPMVVRTIRAGRFLYKHNNPQPKKVNDKRLLDVLVADSKVPNSLRMFPEQPKEDQQGLQTSLF